MTDAETETPILLPPEAKNGLTGKDPDAGKDWRQEEKGMTEDEIVGWHHRLNGHEFEQAPGVGDGQGGLHAAVHGAAKSWTWLSDWSELNIFMYFTVNIYIFVIVSYFIIQLKKCTYIWIYTYMCIYIYVYIHMYIYTHICMSDKIIYMKILRDIWWGLCFSR